MLSDLRALGPLHHHSPRFVDAAFCLLAVAATIAWSAASGKDLNWDQLNYHFYVGYAFLHDRLTADFMAANGQSTLNPLVYVPFYWMVSKGWASLLIASTLAAFHALNMVLLYCIARTVLPQNTTGQIGACMTGVILGFLSPMFLLEAGTTFADISTSVPMLAALWFVLRGDAFHARRYTLVLLGGVLAGVAGGLKLSNLVFLPAFAVCLPFLHPRWKDLSIAAATFGAGVVLGLLLSHGYWSWRLIDAFGGSGLTLGSLISSPELPAGTPLPNRYLPENLLEGVVLPFNMMQLRSWIYVENVAGDLRLGIIELLLLVSAGAWLIRKWRSPDVDPQSDSSRKARAYVGFFIASLALWIATSSNGRYGIVPSILAGPALVLLAIHLFRSRRIALISLGAVILLQLVHLHNSQLRWSSEQWTQSWYEVSIPERLQREPFLYLSLGGNSNSYVAPFLAPQSSFSNPAGQISFDFDGPGGARLQRLLDQYAGRVRVIAETQAGEAPQVREAWLRSANSVVGRFGYAVNAADCVDFSTDGPREKQGMNYSAAVKQGRNHLRTCALAPHEYQWSAERQRITHIIRKMAASCPRLFTPIQAVVEQSPEGWHAAFVSTDTTVIIREGIIVATQPRTSADISLGTLDSWERSEQVLDCDTLPTRFRKHYNFDQIR